MAANAALARIYQNVVTLLDIGYFPGIDAPAIIEARQLIQSVLQEIVANEQANQPPVTSDRPGTDTSGVGGSGVPNPRRKGRKRKAD